MDQNKTDLVMQFVLNGKAVWAECALDIAPGDTLMNEFTKNANYQNYTNFFEVMGFQMGLSLKEDDQASGAPTAHAPQPGQPAKGPAAGAFARWRSASPDEAKKIQYPLEFDKFSFDRIIDHASPIFFGCCCTSTTFDKAILVKRISQGHHHGTFRPSVGFLRIEFTKVLITGINWDDGDVVKEQCEFICQEMKIRYRQQATQGAVGAEMPVHWPTARSLGVRGNTGTK